jgi:hypothetical protein
MEILHSSLKYYEENQTRNYFINWSFEELLLDKLEGMDWNDLFVTEIAAIEWPNDFNSPEKIRTEVMIRGLELLLKGMMKQKPKK